MKEKTKLRIILAFVIGYLAIFTIISLFNKNYEFLYYTVLMFIIIFIAVLYYKKLHLPIVVLAGFAFLGGLHVMGGNIFIKGIRLFDLWLIPQVFKYDNFVHLFATFFVTLAAYSLFYPLLDKKIKQNKFLLCFLLVLIASGIGALYEIIELGSVVFLDAKEGVGDYMNNAIDLVFNLLSSILACVFLMVYYEKQQKNLDL
jgi:uncharacterized membrane protein YjdF